MGEVILKGERCWGHFENRKSWGQKSKKKKEEEIRRTRKKRNSASFRIRNPPFLDEIEKWLNQLKEGMERNSGIVKFFEMVKY